jgi:hypothetical protein
MKLNHELASLARLWLRCAIEAALADRQSAEQLRVRNRAASVGNGLARMLNSQRDHRSSRVRSALRATLLGLCVIASRCDRRVGQRCGWRWDTDRGLSIRLLRRAPSRAVVSECERLLITAMAGRYSAAEFGELVTEVGGRSAAYAINCSHSALLPMPGSPDTIASPPTAAMASPSAACSYRSSRSRLTNVRR